MSTEWDTVLKDVSDVVTALAPLASAAAPGYATAISIGAKIIQGAIELEPQAVSLYQQILDGKTPTPEDVASFATAYEASYQKLDADIKAKLAALPSG